ncbi:MAG: EamA family transporter [Candidatus Lokiarchaeota archaeon]|nr:EamA family transporter [Candidatus Lokiarchaeota archaeon]MBD3339155.1 EamA family transporter [Candidatus Lokiarchaeota archaeon]
MQNKYIFYIAGACLLWGLIPTLVSGLFKEVSLITIIFLRFFVSGIALLSLSFFLVYYNNHHTTKEPIKLKTILKFVYSDNKNFYGMKRIYYLSILGFFGIILQLIFYFLSLKTTSISLTMIGFQLSVIMVVIYGHAMQKERLDFFKFLYITLLLFSIGIIFFVKGDNLFLEQANASLIGFFYILAFALCLSFFQITVDRDSFSKDEIELINSNEDYKIIRLLLKISIIFLSGIGLMLPLLIILYFIPLNTFLTPEIKQFPLDLLDVNVIFRWEILFLIIFSTIIPYLLLFIANAKWSPYNLTYHQWNNVLTIIEPIGGICFGVFFRVETFPLEYLIIVVFLLVLSILFRYVHEATNKINAFIVLQEKKGTLKSIPYWLLKLNGVHAVYTLVGKFDLLINIRSNSMKEFNNLVNNSIRPLQELKIITILFINKVNKV